MADRHYFGFLNGAFVADASPKVQLAVGSGLMATPVWATVVQNISMIASMVAAVCGAVIGIHAVYRLVRPRR